MSSQMETEMIWFRKREEYSGKAIGWMAVFAVMALSSGIVAFTAAAQEPARSSEQAMTVKSAPAKGQQTFPSAQAACDALIAALQNDNTEALLKVLGPDAGEILSSGDGTEDRQNRNSFLEKYKQMHRLLTEQNGLTTLYVGAENWPTPIPLARKAGSWYFDTAAGKQEILYRRIGQNELTVIQVCGELVAAEKEYYAEPRDGSQEKQYARRMLSSPGKHDGLYWQTDAGEAESPLGPFLATAEQEGYPEGASPRRTPFYGYYFRLLKAQGAKASGGAMSYLANGKMTGGFAFLAYPAEYRSSGVMTFVVGADGVVYQKDFGPGTSKAVQSLREYNPDSTWRKANEALSVAP